jgi:hypothetical protein
MSLALYHSRVRSNDLLGITTSATCGNLLTVNRVLRGVRLNKSKRNVVTELDASTYPLKNFVSVDIDGADAQALHAECIVAWVDRKPCDELTQVGATTCRRELPI